MSEFRPLLSAALVAMGLTAFSPAFAVDPVVGKANPAWSCAKTFKWHKQGESCVLDEAIAACPRGTHFYKAYWNRDKAAYECLVDDERALSASCPAGFNTQKMQTQTFNGTQDALKCLDYATPTCPNGFAKKTDMAGTLPLYSCLKMSIDNPGPTRP